MLGTKKKGTHLVNESDILKRNVFFRVRTFSGVNYLFGQNLSYELNETANMIWEGINGFDSVLDIEKVIAEEYSTTVDDIREGILLFIDEMMKAGVFQKVEV